jgi:transcriptional regulator with XRE-family HTH domain
LGVDKKQEKELKLALGSQIRRLRTTKGFTLRGFANEADMDYSLLARFETGKISPTISTVYKIAKASLVTFSEVFDFQLPE